MDKLNYATPIRYFFKQGFPIYSGRDLLTYQFDIDNSKKLIRDLKYLVAGYVENSNIEYGKLGNIDGFFVHDFKKFGYSITWNLSDDEFTFPYLQLFFNNDVVKITTYGLAHRYESIKGLKVQEQVESMMNKYGLSWNIFTGFLRADFAIDILGIDPLTFKKRLLKTNPKGFKNRVIKEFTKNEELETLNIGNKRDKYVFTRIYNKYIDNRKKHKLGYYLEYTNPSTRLEFEMGRNFIGHLSLQEIKSKINSYMGFNKDFKGSYYIRKKDYSTDHIYDINKYKQKRINYTVKLANNNIDFKKVLKEVNKKQDKYYFRVKKFDKNLSSVNK